MGGTSPVDTGLKVIAWMAYGSVFLVALYQIATMVRVWNTLRTLRKRAMRFRVLMAVFSASRFGEIALELFGSPVRALGKDGERTSMFLHAIRVWAQSAGWWWAWVWERSWS